MSQLNEPNAITLIDEHLRELGWNLKDFSKITKNYPLPSGRSHSLLFLSSPSQYQKF
ncbi:MAG: hypothetical protein ACE5J3_14135 [Methanosarcinales archaeon]